MCLSATKEQYEKTKKTFVKEIAFYHILKSLESLVKPMFILNCTMFLPHFLQMW